MGMNFWSPQTGEMGDGWFYSYDAKKSGESNRPINQAHGLMTTHHFTSWLGLAPNTKISGGKIISSRIKRKRHHAGQAFRMAANSLW